MLLSDASVFVDGAPEVVVGAEVLAVEVVVVVAGSPVVLGFEALLVVLVAVPLVVELPGISTQM